MSAEPREEKCEQVGQMPHDPHHHKLSPADPPNAYWCPGWSR